MVRGVSPGPIPAVSAVWRGQRAGSLRAPVLLACLPRAGSESWGEVETNPLHCPRALNLPVPPGKAIRERRSAPLPLGVS